MRAEGCVRTRKRRTITMTGPGERAGEGRAAAREEPSCERSGKGREVEGIVCNKERWKKTPMRLGRRGGRNLIGSREGGELSARAEVR